MIWKIHISHIIGNKFSAFEMLASYIRYQPESTVKLGNKEQIGIKEPFPVTNLPFTS